MIKEQQFGEEQQRIDDQGSTTKLQPKQNEPNNHQISAQVKQEQTLLSRQSFQNQKQTKNQNQESEQENLQSTIDEQVAGFNIIGQDSTNQILQVNLYPKEKIFIRGKIIYANFDYRDKNQYFGYQQFYDFIKELIFSGFHPMIKVHNIKKHICYFGISKGGGKILQVDNDIYGDEIYVNPGKIILSNVNHQNSVSKKHPNLLKFRNRLKIDQKGKVQKTLILLQSLNNNLIIQKYLGPREKLYVQQRSILCLSGTVKAKPSLAGLLTAKLQGPGWVFVQNDSNSFIRENKILFALIFTILFIFWMELFIDVV